MSITRSIGSWRCSGPSLVISLCLVATFVTIGGDWDWLVAVGDHVRRTGTLPVSVPFAAADSTGWHNVPVGGELAASWLRSGGERAAVIAHLVLVASALSVVALAARGRGASDRAVAAALGVVVLGNLAALGVVRAQTFSYLPFALLAALVVRQHRRPDRGVWWAIPLIACWGNFHGAVLLGTCVLGAYLVVDRLPVRPAESTAVGAASLLALCLTTQGWHTPAYYLAVLDNVSARRREGLWARPSTGDVFDLLMLAAALVLVVVFLRRRRPAWEYVAVAGTCVATASAARHGIWLCLLLVVLLVPARTRPSGPGRATEEPPAARGRYAGVAAWVVVAALLSVAVALARGPQVLGARTELVAAVSELAGDRVVLAPAPLSEALAVDGVRLWVSNPIDAFAAEDQAAYLDFLDGRDGGAAAIRSSGLVVTRDGTPADELAAGTDGLTEVPCAPGWSCRVVD